MAVPVNRDAFKEYILRRLGDPVIQINVDDDQVDDRVDDALNLYWESHYDGVHDEYLKHQITAEDKVNKWIPVSDNIVGVVKIFPLHGSGGRVGDIFDVQYQMMLNDMQSLTSVSLVPYYQAMTHLSAINELLVGQIPVRFNKHRNRLHIDMNWDRVNVGNFILVQSHMIVDPNEFPDVWKDRWFQAYATALVKKQWGQNISKTSGIQLPGGATLNGLEIYQQAETEIQKLEDELRDKYTMPTMDMMG